MELPLCDMCGERLATVYIQVTGADVHEEKRLCAECAAEHELDLVPFTLEVSPDGEIDISLRAATGTDKAAEPQELPDERCSQCGTTSSDVAATGLVGCPQCYDNLAATVAGLVATVQPGYPGTTPEAQEPQPNFSTLAKLQLQLVEAVANEDYERAARLRDSIRQTQAEGSSVKGQEAGH
jgi:protein arginine kinase activator